MFDAVRNNKRIVQIFLALITLPFAFFGVESYVRGMGDGDSVAKFGDQKITQQQFQQALREQQDRMRNAMGGQLDPRLFDTPEARRAVLNDLIDQRLLLLESSKQRLVAGDDAIRRTIAGIDAFKVDGQFSKERYETLLRAQGMNPTGFEAQLRQDLVMQQLAGGLARSGMVSRTVLDRLVALQTEQREVREVRLAADAYLDKVKLADGAAQKFYDENGKRFDLPEQARAEYVVLSLDQIAGQVSVSENEIKAWYDSHQDRYRLPEERRASHILIPAEKEADKAAARAKAEEVLKEVQKAPNSFAELAKKYSRDPGSAAKGGDLGFFGRGMMVKSFDEAVFKMKEGEISGIVESEFGFHIIKLTAIRASGGKPLSEVRGEIEAELRKAAAGRKYAEAAETFTNMVYEQADSLKPVAEHFHLQIKQTDWLGRQPNPAAGPLANEKLLAALFGEDSVKNKRNTEAVEVAKNTLVAARLLDYKPVSRQPFESVKAAIETQLKHEEAAKLAAADGAARLAALQKGEDKQAWGEAKRVSRMDARALPQVAVEPVFKLAADHLPAYTGVEVPGNGYVLYKLTAVSAPQLDDARVKPMAQQLANLLKQEEMQAYLAALRTRYKVEVNQKVLDEAAPAR